MSEKTKFILVIVACAIVITQLAINNVNLIKDNNELKLKLKGFEKRLQDVEAEWDSVHVITKKIDKLAPKINKTSKKQLGFYIHYYGKKYERREILQDIMISLPSVESTYYQYAVGNVGEVGWYQINPIHITKREFQSYDLYSAEYQVKKAYKILDRKFSIFKTTQCAINGYNGWTSVKNPYYEKVVAQLEKIENI